jgi:hypothetical protein
MGIATGSVHSGNSKFAYGRKKFYGFGEAGGHQELEFAGALSC